MGSAGQGLTTALMKIQSPPAFDLQVDGKRGPGRPKMTWKQLTERDRR